MNPTITKSTVETLLKTWMICEATIHLQDCLRENSKEFYHQFKACAESCFDMARDLMDPSGDFTIEHRVACIIECQTCARICQEFADVPEIVFCGTVCENCMTNLVKMNLHYQLN